MPVPPTGYSTIASEPKSNAEVTARYQAAVSNILAMLKQQRADDAAAACQSLLRSHPESNDALLLLGKARQQQGRFDDMLQLLETALSRAPELVTLQIQFIGACQFCGDHHRAVRQLATLERAARNDASLLQHVAQLYANSNRHKDAHRCYLRAVDLDNKNPRYLYNLASSFVAIGELQQAEDTYNRVIELDSANHDARYNRSTLRKQSPSDNHVKELENALRKLKPGDDGEAALCYALAKEYEDLGEDERSFSRLQRGAASHRRSINYDVKAETALMERIAEIFDRKHAENTKSGPEIRGPIFVLGLPRSGTTLVDRIISTHSGVESLGEIPDFALALTRLGRTTDSHRLLDVSVDIDPAELGQSYVRSVETYGTGAQYVIDKTPTNFLYIGLIAKALPGASIVHVRRHPVDSCLAMYRVLFNKGYLFSYDLDELAQYYIAYDALMGHWHSLFPDTVFDVSYEDLVQNQESVSKKLIAHCGLPWESACLEFDRNAAPVNSASAAQVRRPIYRDALARWRRFESQLKPLTEHLQAAGIAI